ncbi:MAG: Exlusion protein FxsA [uncultured Thiotrichaceae bacterium]|uniref:Exlusion protein FxsA n=1 Tax=uncultured Thiotrichaceae bacterium TaxID=298394 RepID=A0A6S6U2E1_9GAMM|nr:MAG: Exlusion protein FxsA [uncultured Thiotrichaceae bacterium]
MRPFPIFAALFFIVPLVEIYFLVKVGEQIGPFKTILLVILTAVAGVYLLRQQGLSTLGRFQKNMASGQLPAKEIFEGFFLLIGGALLLTPGFFTDFVGFLCVIPVTRQFMAKRILANSNVSMSGAGFSRGRTSPDDHVYEGEYSAKPDELLERK